MLSPRKIMIAMIALLTAANVNSADAQRMRHRSAKPRTMIVCPPECPPYQMMDPSDVFPELQPPATRDEPAPAPKLDGEQSEQDSQDQAQQPTQPQAPQTAPPTFNPPSQPTTAATSPLSSAPNMIGDFFGNTTTFNVRTPGIGIVAPNAITNTAAAPHFVDMNLTSDGRLQINTMFTNFGVGPYPVTLESLHTETVINTINPAAGGTLAMPVPWSDSPGFDRFDLRAVVGETYPIDLDMDGVAEGFTIINGGSAILATPPAAPNNAVSKDGGDNTYTAGVDDPFTITADAINIPILNVQVPVGALAGRIKLAENSSPMPRDRIFVDYSYFDQIALAPGGVNVNRITPGFEKTFLDGDASFEIRTPFATTLDSDIDNVNLGGPYSSDKVEFGNLWTNLKFLLYHNQEFALSTGLGITFPTADDTSVALSNGVESFRVNNNALHVMPFLGALWTPNSRFFAQGILQVDASTNGNEVLANLNPNDLAFFDPVNNVVVDLAGPTGLRQIGELDDPTFLYADLSLGYWFYQNNCANSCITGIAGLFELHYNTTLESFDSVRADIPGTGILHPTDPSLTYDPVQFQINGPKEFDALNLLIGSTIEMKRNTTVQLGYGLPIAEDKVFDGEFRLNFNHYFGRSARRTPLTRANSL